MRADFCPLRGCRPTPDVNEVEWRGRKSPAKAAGPRWREGRWSRPVVPCRYRVYRPDGAGVARAHGLSGRVRAGKRAAVTLAGHRVGSDTVSRNAPRKSDRVTAWVTPALKAHLDQVLAQRRKKDPTYAMADLVREAIRALIDQEDDILGSKAHQVRTFKRQADRLAVHITRLERRVAGLVAVNIQLVALIAAVQMGQGDARSVDPQKLIDIARKTAAGERGQHSLQALLTFADGLPLDEADS